MVTLHQLAYCTVNKRLSPNRSGHSSYIGPGERAKVLGGRGDAMQVSQTRNDDGKESGTGEADDAVEADRPDEQNESDSGDSPDPPESPDSPDSPDSSEGCESDRKDD
jgi:hypothetical protein